MSDRIERPIVFFDGSCVLCNGFVDRILRADQRARLFFAPLEGETARELLPPLPTDPGVWSVIYLDESGVHRESEAALKICRQLGGWWRMSGLLRVVPKSLRNALYRAVARRRYAWFGKRDVCRTLSADERFLP